MDRPRKRRSAKCSGVAVGGARSCGRSSTISRHENFAVGDVMDVRPFLKRSWHTAKVILRKPVRSPRPEPDQTFDRCLCASMQILSLGNAAPFPPRTGFTLVLTPCSGIPATAPVRVIAHRRGDQAALPLADVRPVSAGHRPSESLRRPINGHRDTRVPWLPECGRRSGRRSRCFVRMSFTSRQAGSRSLGEISKDIRPGSSRLTQPISESRRDAVRVAE